MRHVARTDDKIGVVRQTKHRPQVLGLVAPIRVHLDEKIVSARQAPLKPLHIGASEAQFSWTGLQVQPRPVAILFQVQDRPARVIGTAVIHHENVKTAVCVHDLRYQLAEIVALVVRRDDDQGVYDVAHDESTHLFRDPAGELRDIFDIAGSAGAPPFALSNASRISPAAAQSTPNPRRMGNQQAVARSILPIGCQYMTT